MGRHIDNMLIVGSNDKMITSTKNMLNSRFGIKDLGLTDVILRIKNQNNIRWAHSKSVTLCCTSRCNSTFIQE